MVYPSSSSKFRCFECAGGIHFLQAPAVERDTIMVIQVQNHVYFIGTSSGSDSGSVLVLTK